MWKGRSESEKKALMKKITSVIAEQLKCLKQYINIVITEYNPAERCTGGTPGDEIL